MPLTIPSIKDATLLDIMTSMNKKTGDPTFSPIDPMKAATTGMLSAPYTSFSAMVHTPQIDRISSLESNNPVSLLAQKDWEDKQAEMQTQNSILGMLGNNTSNPPDAPTIPSYPYPMDSAFNTVANDPFSQQDAMDAKAIADSYDQLGKLFSVNTPSSSSDYWKTAAPIRLNQSKLDEYNTPPTKYGPDFIRAIFEANKDKNFVQRALNPTKSLDLGNGDFATHQMSYSTIDNGKARMYPEVVEIDGKLVQLDPKAAYEYAVANNEFIDLPEKDAEWLSQNYKSIWTPENYRIMQAKGTQSPTVSKMESDYTNITDPSKVTVTTPPAPVTAGSTKNAVTASSSLSTKPLKTVENTVTPMMEDTVFNSLHARIDLLRDSSSDILTTQQLLHLEDMIPMDPKGAEAIITSLESQAKAMGNNRGPFGGGYNQYLETLSHVEQGERDVVEKYKKLFEDRGVILKDKPTPNWFMLAAGLMIGGKGGAAFLNGYTQSYQARYQNERNSKLQIVEDQMKALEMDAKMLGSEENFSKARLSVAADTAKILGQMKDTIMARYTVEKAPELQNLLKWEVQNTLNKNGEYTQSTFPDLQKYMLATKIAKTPKEAEVAARIYLSYKQDSIQKMSSQMLYNIWSTNLQTEAIAQRKAMQSTVPDMLTTGKTMYFTVPPNTKESQLPVATLNKFQSSGTLPVLSKVAQLISTGVIPLSLTSTPYELTSGLPTEIKEDAAYKKYYGSNPAQLLKDVNEMINSFNTNINLPKLQEEVNKNTGEMASAYTTIMKYISPSVAGLSPDAQRVVKTMVGQVAFSTPDLATNPSVLKTFTQYLTSLGNDKLKKLATPTNIYDDIDYATVLPQASGLFLQFVNGLSDKTSKLSQIDQQNAAYLAASKNDTKLLREGLTTLQSYKSGVSTSLATTPTAAINTSMFGETIGLEDYTSFSTAAMKAALYSAISNSLPREHPELKLFIGDSDAAMSTIASKTKPDMRDEFNLYNVYTTKTDPTKFTNIIDDYISKLNTSAINDTYGSLAYSVNLGGGDITEFSNTKLNTPKVKAVLDSILTLKNELANSNESLNDASTRRKLQQLDQALKRYRELLSK